MYSFNFPKMLRSNTSVLIRDKEAVKSNLNLILNSEMTSLFGDPMYGTDLKTMIFEQADSLIVDLIIDKLYTAIVTFIPQLYLTRKDIKVYIKQNDVFADVKCVYIPDNTSDLYTINLTSLDSF